MKNLIVEIEDSTKAELIEKVRVNHFSDLGHQVKDAIEDFVRLNQGALIPPLSIRVREKGRDDACGGAEDSPA